LDWETIVAFFQNNIFICCKSSPTIRTLEHTMEINLTRISGTIAQTAEVINTFDESLGKVKKRKNSFKT